MCDKFGEKKIYCNNNRMYFLFYDLCVGIYKKHRPSLTIFLATKCSRWPTQPIACQRATSYDIGRHHITHCTARKYVYTTQNHSCSSFFFPDHFFSLADIPITRAWKHTHTAAAAHVSCSRLFSYVSHLYSGSVRWLADI